jgi:hypothetical protein
MEYSIPVITEQEKNYFLVCYEDMRFLFRRLHAASLIAFPEGIIMDRFEIRRNNEIIITGDCYHLCEKIPIFWIQYSELTAYNPMRNTSEPHETLYAEDFLAGDMVFSDVNAHEVKVKSFVSTMSFMEQLDAQLLSLSNGLTQTNIKMMISVGQSFIRRVENDQDVLGLKTFIIPDYF